MGPIAPWSPEGNTSTTIAPDPAQTKSVRSRARVGDTHLRTPQSFLILQHDACILQYQKSVFRSGGRCPTREFRAMGPTPPITAPNGRRRREHRRRLKAGTCEGLREHSPEGQRHLQRFLQRLATGRNGAPQALRRTERPFRLRRHSLPRRRRASPRIDPPVDCGRHKGGAIARHQSPDRQTKRGRRPSRTEGSIGLAGDPRRTPRPPGLGDTSIDHPREQANASRVLSSYPARPRRLQSAAAGELRMGTRMAR